MRQLATTEINEQGIVTAISLPKSSFWKAFLPTIGDSLHFWNNNSNNQLREYITQIFESTCPIKYSITINNCPLQCTAFRSTPHTATIFWDTVVETDFTSTSKVNEFRAKLTDFAFKNISEAIIFYREDGSIYDCNEAFCKMYGIERTGTLTMTLFDFGTGFSKQSFKQYWERVKSLGSFKFYAQRTKADGTAMDVEIVPNYIKYEETELICSIIRDITEQKQIENTLIKERTLLRTLIDTLPFPVYIKDANARKLITNKHDVELLMQLDSEENVIGKTDLEIFKDTPNHIGFSQDIQVLTTGKPIIEEFETLNTKRNGRLNLLTTKMPISDGFGNIIGLVGFCRDITEALILEKELKLIGYAFENVDTAIYFAKQDGSHYEANQAMCSMLGYSRKEFVDISIFDVNPSINKSSWEEIWKLQHYDSSRILYTSLKRKNGELIDVELKSKLISYDGIDLSCAFITNITEKKKIEESLRLVDFAFRSTGIPMHFVKEDGQLFDCNDAACKLLGYTREEYLDLKIFQLNGNISMEDYKKNWATLTIDSNRILRFKIAKKGGELIDAEIRMNKIKYGDFELMVSSFIDITEKKKIEKKLNIVDYAFRNASVPMYFIKKDGSIYDFNSKICELLGYSIEEVRNTSIFEYSKDLNSDNWEYRWNYLNSNKNEPYYTKLRRKDNTLVDVEIRSNFFEYENEELRFATIIDVTEKLRIEESLKSSNERYENAMLATSDVVWEADIEKGIVFHSKNFSLIFGHQKNGFEYGEDNVWEQNLHPDDKERVYDVNANVINGLNDKWEMEYRFRKADGNYAIVLDRGFSVKNHDGKVLRIVGAMQDITLRKAEESRLKLLESVVVHTNDAILISEAEPIEEPGPKIIYVNDAYTKITGYTLEESVGTNPRKLQNSNTDRNELDKFKRSLEKWQPCEMTVKNVKKNGEEFWANIRVSPVADEKGWFTHWISVQRDVTKEIEAQKEKEALINELINNNNELKQFGYITTHNLRSPLTNLVSICKMMDESKIEDNFTRKLVSGFRESTYLLNETLNDLIKILFIKERVSNKMENLSLEEILNKVKESISFESKNMTIESDFSLAPSVNFSNAYLESMFINLITNSIRYAHPMRDPIIRITSFKQMDNKVKLIFTDNGVGMDMEKVKGRIFGLYQRFHDNTESKGLGLYLIHSQITSLGGTIEVDSKENVGTIFTIIFKNKG